MICPPCRVAAECNRLALVKYPEGHRLRNVMTEQAVTLHKECDGRCDCQHQTGEWLQQEFR